MFTLRVEAPVSSLRPACFFIRDAEGRLLARIREIRGEACFAAFSSTRGSAPL